MKKIVLTLVIIIFAGVIAVAAIFTDKFFNQKIDLTVVSDTHVVANSLINENNIAYYSTQNKMIHAGEAVLNTLADQFIKEKKKYVFLTGDLTEAGDETSHRAVAGILKRMEDHNIKVYVINGNHDLADSIDKPVTVTAEQFKTIYHDFGYGEAIASHAGTLSYVVDLDNNYRLIAVDNTAYYRTESRVNRNWKEHLDPVHEEWLRAQVTRSVADGKTPLVMSHEPFINHFPQVFSLLLDRTQLAKYNSLIQFFADNKVKIALTGHFHAQHVASIKTERGNEFYDIGTGSSVASHTVYREIQYSRTKIDIRTQEIKNVDKNYLSAHISEEERNAMAENYVAFAQKHFHRAIKDVVSQIGAEDGYLKEMIKGEGNRAKFMRLMLPVLDKLVSAPLYMADETEGGYASLERIVSAYGITLPKIEFKTVTELAPYIVERLLSGDMALLTENEQVIAKYLVFSAFHYIDELKTEIAEIIPDVPQPNIDCQQLFKTGVLECYDSNIVPFLLKVFFDGSDAVDKALNNAIGKDFANISALRLVLTMLGLNSFEGIFDYFGDYEIELGSLISKGIFTQFVPEINTALSPSDNFLVIKLI